MVIVCVQKRLPLSWQQALISRATYYLFRWFTRPSGYSQKKVTVITSVAPGLWREEHGGLAFPGCQPAGLSSCSPSTAHGSSPALTRTTEGLSILNALHQLRYSVLKEDVNFNWNIYSERLCGHHYFEGKRHFKSWRGKVLILPEQPGIFILCSEYRLAPRFQPKFTSTSALWPAPDNGRERRYERVPCPQTESK